MEPLDRAMRLLEEANADLAPQRCSRTEAHRLLRYYTRLKNLAAFGEAALAARLDNPTELARVSGTTVGRARQTIETGRRLAQEPRLAEAARSAEVSVDQAAEIARTTTVAPETLDGLLTVARNEAFHVLKDKARSLRLAATDPATLHQRQHQARRLRHWVGDMGMIHLEAALEPHIGAPLINRLDTEARRHAHSSGEPFERLLADALPTLTGGGTTRKGHAEVVVLVSHEITQRGWTDVRQGEHCKIPGIGPISPQAARQIAQDAFLNALFYDGEDLRHLTRWTRHIPAQIRLALQLGPPPDFEGPRCIDCGNRYGLQWDHLRPFSAGGPTSLTNNEPRCLPCHIRKTRQDRRAGKTHRPRTPPLPQPP